MEENKTFTQEELNSIVSERVNKEKSKLAEVEAKASGFETQIAELRKKIDELNNQAKAYQTDIAEKDKRLKEYDTQSVKMRIAKDAGIPIELAGRLSGNTEDELKSDAESLKSILGAQRATQPLRNSESPTDGASTSDTALRKLASQIVK